MIGLVITTTGVSYHVLLPTGETIDCVVKGNFRTRGIRSTNPVTVGDKVQIERQEDGTNWITEIEDRRNYIIRRSTNLSKQSHILASNIDLAVLVVTLYHPETSLTFIDRFLATAEAYNIPTMLLFNKIDLLTDLQKSELDQVRQIYERINYNTLCISATKLTENDRQDLINRLGTITLFSGNSGVGKSTLLNAIVGEEIAKTAAISHAHDMGMHTTTFSQMYKIKSTNDDKFIIDTPGIKGFGSHDMQKEEISHYFREIFSTARNCRFSNCTHTGEPGCAVIEAVENGHIASSRFHSYLSMLGDSEEKKYR